MGGIRNRLPDRTEKGPIETSLSHAASRRTRITHPSGLKTEYAYNNANWVLGVYTNTSGGSVVESFTYTYDKVGNRKTMVENGGNTSTYGYDVTYRLKNESYTGGLVINYTYDGVGNRLTDVRNEVTTSYTYDADNRLTAQGATTFGYDDNGNQIRKTFGGQNTTYEWDIENRLTKVTFPNATSVQYEYSTDGNRGSRTQGGVKSWFAYDYRDRNGFDDVIAEYNATGGLVARYDHGPGVDEPLLLIREAAYFFAFDALGSVTRPTTSTQDTGSRYRYEAFGAVREVSEGVSNSRLFAARERDPTLAIYFYRARWYDSRIGRFLSRDPAGLVDGPNVYSYAANNPATNTDPGGNTHSWWQVGPLCADSQGNRAYFLWTKVYRLGDKWSHCVWGCLMVQHCRLSRNDASMFAYFREIEDLRDPDPQVRADSLVDLRATFDGIYFVARRCAGDYLSVAICEAVAERECIRGCTNQGWRGWNPPP